ncbi:hypothetical protein QQP08_018674 [Theobroma cacao]|nr:hypothetical protein QQP08_018674 [Theobroma cacao]
MLANWDLVNCDVVLASLWILAAVYGLMLRNILMLSQKSHGQCWRHPYLASKAMMGLSFVIFAVDQGAISMVFF